MKRETLRVELVTPCFLGGASHAAEWRAASIRGELRWWFRAVAGAEWSLEEVRKGEERLFGATHRQARLRIRALGGPEPQQSGADFDRRLFAKEIAKRWQDTGPETADRLRLMKDGREIPSNPLQYLGFGPFEKGRLERTYLPARSSAEFSLDWRPGPIDSGLQSLFEDALWAWLNLGGIGAKSRRGYGSLKLLGRNPPPAGEPQGDREVFKERARKLLERARLHTAEPRWTHFSSRSRIFLATSQSFSTWQEAMEHLGSWLIAYRRRYGSARDSRTVDGLPLKNRDYEWAAPHGRNPGKEIPDRAGFGLPLLFKRKSGHSSSGENVTWVAGDGDDGAETHRSSPLHLHIARFDRSHVPVLTYLPARLIPGKLKFQDHDDLFDPTPRQLGIIDEFLSDLAAKNLIEEVET